MRAVVSILLALSASSLVACAEPTPEQAQATAESTSSAATAVVVLERTAGPNDAARGDAVIARFVRVRQGQVDDPALRLAGIAEDSPPPGTCTVPAETPSAPQGRSVELLDVGQVVVTSESAARSTVLLPRSMPEPAGVVSGVFYSARAADVFSAGSRISLRSVGGTDLADGFSVSATAPREVADVHVTSTANGFDVSWDPIESDAHDLFYVDTLAPGGRVVSRCTSADANHVVLPQGSFLGIDDGQLAVHRVHKESFRAKGIEPGEIRFDLARIVNVRP
jgi:hypothetical protein